MVRRRRRSAAIRSHVSRSKRRVPFWMRMAGRVPRRAIWRTVPSATPRTRAAREVVRRSSLQRTTLGKIMPHAAYGSVH